MQVYTIEDLQKFKTSGDYTTIKSFPERCSFCEWRSFGEYCDFGRWCNFGEWCGFGEGCRFGKHCDFGRWCGFGEGCSFGEGCNFGKCCRFGEGCSFGKGCKCEGGHEFRELFMVDYIGSRKDTTQFWHLTDGGILVRCGCFCGLLDEFAAKVKETHGDNQYAKEYMAAIELAKVKFGVVTDED